MSQIVYYDTAKDGDQFRVSTKLGVLTLEGLGTTEQEALDQMKDLVTRVMPEENTLIWMKTGSLDTEGDADDVQR